MSDVVFTREVLHRVERVPDDRRFSPAGGGDCFVCSSHAVISHFARQAGSAPPQLEETYQLWQEVEAPNGPGAHQTTDFWHLAGDVHGLEHVIDPPWELEPNPGYKLPSLYSHHSYARRVRVYLEAGYLIHAQQLMDRRSELVAKGERCIPPSNHLVVIDGVRTVTRYRMVGETRAGRIDEQLHVVCSSSRNPEPYWINAEEWVEEHNGFGMWFVRPERS